MPSERTLRWRKSLHALLAQHAAPGSLGWAAAVGVMVGSSPFFGFHTLIALGLAAVLRLNPVAVTLGSQITFPPLAPLVFFAELQVGYWLLHRHALGLTLAGFRHAGIAQTARELFVVIVVGWLLVGTGLAASVGVLTTASVRRFRRRNSVLILAVETEKASSKPTPMS